MSVERRAWVWAAALGAVIVGLVGATSRSRADTSGSFVDVEGPDPNGEHARSYFSFFRGWAVDPGPLDVVPRFVEEGQRFTCSPDELTTYRSRSLRYNVRVAPSFAERLLRFDDLVREIAVAHYGRAPRRLLHRGAYSCRSARGRTERISEHALGNAIDVQGFDLGPLPRRAIAPAEMPTSMRRAFSVRVATHWSPRRARDVYHAAFLHRLAEAVRERPEIFRGIVGPPRPRHHDHLHLDAAPWQYAMFAYDP